MLLNEKKNFLRADDVKDGDILKFMDEGEWIESTKFQNEDGSPKKQLMFQVEFKGEPKDLSINATSRHALIEAWGRETAEWVGKEAKIELVKQNVGGKIMNVVYLKAA